MGRSVSFPQGADLQSWASVPGRWGTHSAQGVESIETSGGRVSTWDSMSWSLYRSLTVASFRPEQPGKAPLWPWLCLCQKARLILINSSSLKEGYISMWLSRICKAPISYSFCATLWFCSFPFYTPLLDCFSESFTLLRLILISHEYVAQRDWSVPKDISRRCWKFCPNPKQKFMWQFLRN